MWKIPNAAASRVSALPEKYKERKHPKRVREQNNIRLDFRQSRSAPPRVPLPVVGSLAPSPKPSVSLLLLREEKRRYRAQRRAQSGPAAPGPGFPRPPTPARSPLTVWSSAQRRRSPAAFWGETERVRQARPGPSSPPRAPGPARYPQSSRSPSMAAVPAPEAEGAGAVLAGAAHARSRRAPPTSAPEAPAPTPGRRLRALTAAARRPARRGTARAESAAPRGAAARSPGPPVSSEAAPRDSPRGGAAARRRGARTAAGSVPTAPWSCPGPCSWASWRPPSPPCPSSRSSTRLTSSCPSSTSSTSQVSAGRGAAESRGWGAGGPLGADTAAPSAQGWVLTALCRSPTAAALPALGVPSLSRCRLFYFCGRALLFIYGEAAVEPSACIPCPSPLGPALSPLAAPGDRVPWALRARLARKDAARPGCRPLCCLDVPPSPQNAAFPAAFTRRVLCPCTVSISFSVAENHPLCHVLESSGCQISVLYDQQHTVLFQLPVNKSAGFLRPDPLQLSASIKFWAPLSPWEGIFSSKHVSL